jgi:arsenate reductase
MEIFHNPRCSKSRQALALLNEKGLEPKVRFYLTETPNQEELRSILAKLGIKAEELVRKGEQVFKDKYKGKQLSENEWISAMVKQPKLIERPILINKDKAVVGRPPEKVLDILD